MVKKIEAELTKLEAQKKKALESTDAKIEKLQAQINKLQSERKTIVEPIDEKIKQLKTLKKKAEQLAEDFSSIN